MTDKHKLDYKFNEITFDNCVNSLIIQLKIYINENNINQFNIYVSYNRQSMLLEGSIDDAQNNVESLERQNLFSAQQFQKGLTDPYIGPEFWPAFFGRSLAPGEFKHFCVCEQDVGYMDKLEYDIYFERGAHYDYPYKTLVKSMHKRNVEWNCYDKDLVVITDGLGPVASC